MSGFASSDSLLASVALLSARLAVIKSSPNHIEPSAAFG